MSEGIDLLADFRMLVATFEQARIEYAVVGALALAIHGFPRATTDIDFLVRREDVRRILELIEPLGYRFPAEPMTFRRSGIEVQRVTRVAAGDHLTLDLLLVNERTQGIWDSRQPVASREGSTWVISREALVEMKALAGRPQDLVDLERLTEGEDA